MTDDGSTDTLLVDAVYRHDVEKAKSLLGKGALVNAKNARSDYMYVY